jgi:hypothetical protein
MNTPILLITATTALNFLVALCPAQQAPSQKRAVPQNLWVKLGTIWQFRRAFCKGMARQMNEGSRKQP